MSSNKALGSSSPAPSVVHQNHSRKTSAGSHISRYTTDQDSKTQVLDRIHNAASRAEGLTTFEFGSPPRPPSTESKNFGSDIVPGGLSSLYNRFRATVGATKDPIPSLSSNEVPDDASITSGHSRYGTLRPSRLAGTSSPTVSASSSRIQSPVAINFPESASAQHLKNQSNPSIEAAASLNPTTPTPSVANRPAIRVSSGHRSRTQSPVPISQRARRTTDSGKSWKQSEVRSFGSEDVEASSHPRIDVQIMQESDHTPRPLGRTIDRRPPLDTSMSPSRNRIEPNAAELLPPADIKGLERPPLIQVSQSHLPGYRVSRDTSVDGEISSVASSLYQAKRSVVEMSNSGGIESASRNTTTGNPAARLKSKVLAKELWMRDETAKECFYCGEPFSTFRRKHHCRICGNIFDGKCTNLVPGKLFGQAGSMRICRPCEGLVYGNEDDSSSYSDDGDRHSSHGRATSPRSTMLDARADVRARQFQDDLNMEAPSLGIPVARKAGHSHRGSAVIEFANEHTLARPSSSRSLKSLSGLHRAPMHKRHQSRQVHQHMKSLKPHFDERAPFQRGSEGTSRANLPALHHDNIIDPDMAQFMSDEELSEDDHMSIFATLNVEAQSPGKDGDKTGLAALMHSTTRRRALHGGSVASRDADNTSLFSKSMSRQRRRNPSVSSLHHPARPSPKRTKSNSLLKGFTVPGFGSPTTQQRSLPASPAQTGGSYKMTRSSAMRGSSAPQVELNAASLQHVRNLLKQMLQDVNVPDIKRWEKALVPILLQCTDDVNPDIHRNDDIDIRHYIKLKKISGSKPGDTAYVSGVVFTKNLALKSMPRSISNPRVLIVTFPIEYARHHTGFQSLDPVIAQEKEYLSNLVKRIVAVNPTVLLVQNNVSGLALSYLERAGIAVVYNVKASVLSAVSRCTETQLVTSADKLSLTPAELGRCESFGVKTYVQGSIKKTYIYFSGCQKDLGCTIVLRGADIDTLKKIKSITEFMCYVVYNLKLETCVMRDEYVHIPAPPSSHTMGSSHATASGKITAMSDSTEASQSLSKLESSGVETEISQVGGTSNAGDRSTTLPSRTDSTIAVSTGAASSVTKVGSEEYQVDEAMPSSAPSFYSNIVEEHKTRITSSSPFVKFMQPHLLAQAREQEIKLTELKKLRDQYKYQRDEDGSESSNEEFELVQPEMVHKLLKKPSKPVQDFLFAVHDAEYEAARHAYHVQKRQWETYLSNNPGMFDPHNHQKIACLYSMVNSKTNPCVGPEMIALSFYGEHDLDEEFLPDITLGQYVEELCQSGDAPCSANDCDDTMFKHHRQYVHGDGQMNVTIQTYPSRIRGMHKTILMWSVCRICGQETQVMPMSENTWKYSFGKYLELTFWSTALHPRAHSCPHDIHRNHVRFFGFNNVAVRIQYDAIGIYDIKVPRPTITWKVDKDLLLKNEQYTRFKTRLDRFLRSVRLRIESIHVDSMPPEKAEDCQVEVNRLLKRVRDDHIRLTKKLQDKYMESRWYEIVPLNRAARALQEISIEWDEIFVDFENNFFPSEKDIRRMTALQLKKLFESATSFAPIEEAQEVVDGEIKEKEKSPVPQSPPGIARRISIMSPEDTKNVLTSVIHDQQVSENLAQTEHTQLEGNEQLKSIAIPPHEAVEREDVKHLDLAISPNHKVSDDAKIDETSPPVQSTSKQILDLELAAQVSATVEKMRDKSGLGESGSLDASPHDTGLHESKIPRPIEPARRLVPTVAPPLHRSQSQPQANASPVMKPFSAFYDADEGPSSIPMSKTEKFRNLLSEPGKAFERSLVNRITSRSVKNSPSLIPRSVPGKRNVLNLARHYEQLTREFEKQRKLERRARETRGAYPLASSKPVVEVYRDAHEAVKETDSVDEPDVSNVGRTSLENSNLDEQSLVEPSQTHDLADAILSSQAPQDSDQVSTTSHTSDVAETAISEHNTVEEDDATAVDSETTQISPTDSQLDLTQLKEEKTSVLKMLTNFWSERTSSGWLPLDYPFLASEHVWGDSDIIVREDEPSSIIAMALSSADYLAKLRSFRKEPPNATTDDINASIESNLLHSKNTNIRYAFQNRGVRAQCKIFYAESFDALRRKCGVSERIVESLSRCLKWDSKGGKTKSLFLKTLDDRFVLKSLSAVEVNSFFKFAPDYFVYAHAVFNGLPSVIAKMLGLFQVTIRNPASGMEFDWFMIVMENLFYDANPNRRFDLKGSMRNRKIQSTGEQDEVLLDENLVDIIFEKPIFVREHTLKLLSASVWNDTLFLSKQNVMDYSLMAGFEDDRREIVVGIIDCIRTYTWDKKLETWIKDRGKNKPTVTSPKDYRNRFRVAMSKYILLAPNCWHQFQAQQIQGRPVQLVGQGGGAGSLDEEELTGLEPGVEAL